MDLSYRIIKVSSSYCTSLLFRDVVIINQENIPKTGATIIYGNHNNQFVDGMLMIHTTNRQIRFIAAAKSVRRAYVGKLIKMCNPIPVERASDLAKKGPGKITKIFNNEINGQGTRFLELQEGSSLEIQPFGQIRIKKIISNEQLLIDKPLDKNEIINPIQYKTIPKVEYNQLYEHVWKCLKDEGCIGIFPEGGSHDRNDLLPLKAGICIMALGAMDKYNIPVTLLSCGFNYYNPQNFRSKVIIQYGVPYKISQEMLQLYRTNKKLAISNLLKDIQMNLRAVTTNIKSFNQLSTLFTCRELYSLKADGPLTQKEKLILNRRFDKGYELLSKQKNKEAMQLFQQVMKFDEYVRITGLPVKSSPKKSFLKDVLNFITHFLQTINHLIFALPGLILLGPTTKLITYLSQKQRIKCLKASKVKVQGNDVVGSYKVLLSIAFFPLTSILNSLAIYKILQKYIKLDKKISKRIAIGIILLLPFYTIFMLKSFDSMGYTLKKLKFYLLRIFQTKTYQEFQHKKSELSKKIREMVDIHGKKLFENFEENRVIRRDRFNNQTSNTENDPNKDDQQSDNVLTQ